MVPLPSASSDQVIPTTSRILKVDPSDGRTIGEFKTPDGGGIRGLLYADKSLWLTCLTWNTVTQLDPDTMEVKHKFPLQLPRSHGIAWDPPGIWIVYQDARLFMKQDVTTGRFWTLSRFRKMQIRFRTA